MRRVRSTAQFRKSLKKFLRSGQSGRQRLAEVINILSAGQKLDFIFRDHELVGKWSGHRECHIKPDLLLVYRIEESNLVLVLVDLENHPALFG